MQEKGAVETSGAGSGAVIDSGTVMESGAPSGLGTDARKVRSGTGARSGTGTQKSGTGTKKSKSGTGAKKRKQKYTMSEAALVARSKGGAASLQVIAKTPEEMAYNARSIEHVMRITEISQHADKSDINSLRDCFVSYLKLCAEDGFKAGNMGAAASMGITHATLAQWAKDDNHPERKQFAQMVMRTCSLIREGMIADQKINPVIGIFWQRNYDGLRNDTETIQASQDDGTGTMTADEYRKKYSDLLDE